MVRDIIDVLLVEDEEAHAEAIKRAFRPLGASVRLRWSSTIRKARAALEDSAPHIIIADWLLPDGKGTDLLPPDKESLTVPMILMTSHGNEQVAVEAMKAGALDYVVKSPSTFSDMPHIVERALQQWDLMADHKRAQEALRISEEQYRAVVEDQTELICRFSGDHRFEFCNGAFCRCFGIDDHRLGGSEIRWLLPEISHQKPEDFLASLTPENSVSSYEIQLPVSQGEPRWFQWTIRALFDNGGKAVAFQAVGRDISERKRAEEALRQSEHRFRTIFEEAEDCIFLKNRSLKYVDVNPAMERLVGRPVSAIKGLRYEELFSQYGSDHIREVEMRVLRGESVEEEFTKRVDGVPLTFLVTRVPMRDSAGEIVGILGIARDFTDRKRLEAPVEALADLDAEFPSMAMRVTLSQALMAAKKASTVLLTGESGAGKDWLARYIHDHSENAGGPYFSINCAAIAPELAESELFGHERGAFTGALNRKRGLLELAEGGTLLLNEMGELSLRLQAKLLTFLDTRKFTRVGGEKEISVSARIIAATNRDLQKEVDEGRFRKDLFYRINVVSITVPPLRERMEDLPLLAQQILSGLARELQAPACPVIDAEFLDQLKRYNWPGNVRELRNILERALITSDGGRLNFEGPASQSPRDDCLYRVCFTPNRTLHDVTDDVVKVICAEALSSTEGNKKEAARILGISRDSLYRYLKKFGMETDD